MHVVFPDPWVRWIAQANLHQLSCKKRTIKGPACRPGLFPLVILNLTLPAYIVVSGCLPAASPASKESKADRIARLQAQIAALEAEMDTPPSGTPASLLVLDSVGLCCVIVCLYIDQYPRMCLKLWEFCDLDYLRLVCNLKKCINYVDDKPQSQMYGIWN